MTGITIKRATGFYRDYKKYVRVTDGIPKKTCEKLLGFYLDSKKSVFGLQWTYRNKIAGFYLDYKSKDHNYRGILKKYLITIIDS